MMEFRTSSARYRIKDAVQAILDRGRGTKMAKVDVKSAYHNIPIHPEDWWMMGMMWEGALYVDRCLPAIWLAIGTKNFYGNC